jgi:hypothetical protein
MVHLPVVRVRFTTTNRCTYLSKDRVYIERLEPLVASASSLVLLNTWFGWLGDDCVLGVRTTTMQQGNNNTKLYATDY